MAATLIDAIRWMAVVEIIGLVVWLFLRWLREVRYVSTCFQFHYVVFVRPNNGGNTWVDSNGPECLDTSWHLWFSLNHHLLIIFIFWGVYFNFFIFSLLIYFLKKFYCYSITVVCLFSPSLHPTPAEPTSLPLIYFFSVTLYHFFPLPLIPLLSTSPWQLLHCCLCPWFF